MGCTVVPGVVQGSNRGGLGFLRGRQSPSSDTMVELPILPVDRVHPGRALCMELESGSGLFRRSGSWGKDGKREGNGVCVCVCVSDVRAIPLQL